ncbi:MULTISPECIES: hypothetical protein [unclassified Bradyrhizobium]|uniref:hypothetical protein n=1 Tax=unclassified Bradyrhizobium TaxID=2631580 RepID=UPI0028EED850|nr:MULTISPECIES: hypothetical protein [unclassified Bradyrhizobium]
MVGSELRAGFQKVAFKADDGTVLRGWHVPPQGDAPTAPIVVLHHGFSGLKESYLDKYAAAFSAAGLGALVYDPAILARAKGASGRRSTRCSNWPTTAMPSPSQ